MCQLVSIMIPGIWHTEPPRSWWSWSMARFIFSRMCWAITASLGAWIRTEGRTWQGKQNNTIRLTVLEHSHHNGWLDILLRPRFFVTPLSLLRQFSCHSRHQRSHISFAMGHFQPGETCLKDVDWRVILTSSMPSMHTLHDNDLPHEHAIGILFAKILSRCFPRP